MRPNIERIQYPGNCLLRRKIVFLLICALVWTSLWIGGCGPRTGWGHTVSSPNLAQVSALSGLFFPAGTRLLHSRLDKWEDSVLIARLVMASGDVDKLMRTLPRSITLSHKDRWVTDRVYGDPAKLPSWWDPKSPRTFTAVEYRNSDGTATTRMLISRSRSQATIYLGWTRQ
jgi:hypothetical protein